MGYSTEKSNQYIVARVMDLKFDIKTPHFFEISKGWGETKEILSENANMISGKLIKIEMSSYERQNKVVPTLSFIIDDEGERIERQTTYNNLSRSAIYCLAGLDKLEHQLFFSLYVSKAGKKNIWVKHGLDDLRNEFDWENDIKARTKAVMDGEEFIKYNYTELDKWINEELIVKINDAVEIKDIEDELAEVEKKPVKAKKTKAKTEEKDDVLPF